MSVRLSNESHKAIDPSRRLHDWLATPKSDDPWTGIQDERALREWRDATSSDSSDGPVAFVVETPLCASDTELSPHLQDWLAQDSSESPYTAGKTKKALNERRSALYAKVDEILTAFQMGSSFYASSVHHERRARAL